MKILMLGRWTHKYTKRYIFTRMYREGFRWSPVVRVDKRFKNEAQ